MAKEADRYFKVEPWRIVEQGFDPEHALVAESVFSLANEYMGIRGFLEEGYSGRTLIGSYFNGIYERRVKKPSGYKGIVNATEFMVNAVNWLDTDIRADGEKLDLAVSEVRDFERSLDMRSGLLTRQFLWVTNSGAVLQMKMERLLSMETTSLGAQRVEIKVLSGSADVRIALGLAGNTIHESVEANMWKCQEIGQKEEDLFLRLSTISTEQLLYSHMHVQTQGAGKRTYRISKEKKSVQCIWQQTITEKTPLLLERTVCNVVMRDKEELEQFCRESAHASKMLEKTSFEEILWRNTGWWKKIWDGSDIEIMGDEANQQGIRFCIFQLFQTYRGAVKGSNIGAKGLTGEAYNGNAFWDTETYCLPFFLFNDMEGAKNLLYFRYRTLDEARKRAKELDCKGAFYPIATISGRECCDLWQHASLQLQASTAVAYGLWLYQKLSGDEEFIKEYGLEILIEISRMLATRGDFSNDGKRYGFYDVMGPDEFQMMVSHNCYTNYMGRFTFEYTMKQIQRIRTEDPQAWQRVMHRTDFQEEETESWAEMAELMYIPYDEERKLYEQHMGFFELPHIDVNSISVEEFPLYSHWSYDRIYRNDMIKQPDVLMMMLLFNGSFTEEQLRCNYEYYEPRCIHESSLSPSVHSILANQLKKRQEAYRFFAFATRMDLDNYNRNSGEGIHTTSIAAAWMNIVYGFGGLRSDGEMLELSPQIPAAWEGYTFRLHIGGKILRVHVNQEQVCLQTEGGRTEEFLLYGEKISADEKERKFFIPEEWRNDSDACDSSFLLQA